VNRIARAAACLTIGIGCSAAGTAARPAHTENAAGGSGSTCHVLEQCYAAAPDRDRDGCPDVAVSFEPGSARLSTEAVAVLESAAREAREVRPSELGLVGSTAPGERAELARERAAAVEQWLRAHAVASVRIAPGREGRGAALWFEPTCRPRAEPGA